jgi:hypothetical protein
MAKDLIISKEEIALIEAELTNKQSAKRRSAAKKNR